MRGGEAPEVALAAEARPLSEYGQGQNFRVGEQGRPTYFRWLKERLSFHQSSTSTYNETKKESRSNAAPSFGESLVQHKVWAPSALI